MIYHLLYISEKSPSFQESDLRDIITKSAAKNKVKNLTGILIHNGDFFIQLLEGKKENVINLFNIISQDKRHTHIRNLMTFQESSRIFPHWSMGLVEGLQHPHTIQELIPLLHGDILKVDSSKKRVITILKKFNNI